MISDICPCPSNAELPVIPNAGCSQNFGQVYKVVFQRLTAEDGTVNQFTTNPSGTGENQVAANPITALASWTAFFTAQKDDTHPAGRKAVVTPVLYGPTAEPGEANTWGGGNDTPDGIEVVTGRSGTNFSATFRRVAQSVAKALKGLQCESYGDNLGVYLINNVGGIMAVTNEAGDAYTPIPINNLFIGDLALNGLDEPDSNAISFTLAPNWSDDVTVISPDFNARTQLKNSEA